MSASTAGRRDSRIHLQLRHSDALQEQEAFRRKYLLVNKHITKLNAGLNLRVEELNAQITQLNSENIALRSKVIELTRKLAAEQASTRRTAAEAESLAANAIRQLASLRDAFANLATPITSPSPQLPVLGPREAVTRTVLAKKPDVSFIRETSQEVEDAPPAHGHPRAKEEEERTPSPPPPAAYITSRRASRRATTINQADLPPPPPPPTRSSEPIVVSSEEEVESELDTPPSMPVRSTTNGKVKAISSVLARQKSPEADDIMPAQGSTRRRLANKENDMDALKEESGEETARTSTVRRAIKRRAVTPPPPEAVAGSSDTPVPASRMLSQQSDNMDPDQPMDGFRERRTRKSVNYAEPKLNTKMRKPEGYGEGKTKPRTSSVSKETTPPASAISSKTPSASSSKAKAPGSLTPAAPMGSMSSDMPEEPDAPKAKTRRHSMAV